MSLVPGASPLVVRMLRPEVSPALWAALALLLDAVAYTSLTLPWRVFVLADLAACADESPAAAVFARFHSTSCACELGPWATKRHDDRADLVRRLLNGVAETVRPRGAERLIASAGADDAPRLRTLVDAGFRAAGVRSAQFSLSPPGVRWFEREL